MSVNPHETGTSVENKIMTVSRNGVLTDQKGSSGFRHPAGLIADAGRVLICYCSHFGIRSTGPAQTTEPATLNRVPLTVAWLAFTG